MGNSSLTPAQNPYMDRNKKLRDLVLWNSQQMSAFTGNGLNILTDMQNKETKVTENPQEIRPTEIIHKHEITVRLDIDHLLN